jgi:hypothetical protein
MFLQEHFENMMSEVIEEAGYGIFAHSRSQRPPRFLPLVFVDTLSEYRQKNPLKCHTLPLI